MDPRYLEELWETFREIRAQLPALQTHPEELWREALAQGRISPLEGVSLPLFRIRRDFKGFSEGTVLGPGLMVPGFPHIPRIFRLKTGVPRYFQGPFYAEEKIEGYNVRIFATPKGPLAVTRRGFVCPFATDRWPDFLPRLPEFLQAHPDLCLCVEVAGPENPFVSEWPPYIKEDVRFFVFDLLHLPSGKLLPPEEKYALLRSYAFPQPEIHGPFYPEDLSGLRELLKRYEAEGREGVVLKPVTQGPRVKYVTPVSNLEDLRVVFPYLGEVPPEYITHRLARYLLGHWELFGDFGEEEYRRLGRSLLEGLASFLSRIDAGEPVTEVFRVRFRSEAAFEALIAHFRHARVRIEVRRKEKRGNYLWVEFVKIYPRATSFWKSKLEGFAVVD